MKIAIAADHAGYEEKEKLKKTLDDLGVEYDDFGTVSTDSVDYPDFGYALGRAVANGSADFGIALCGSGVGISIAVNRNPAARCALVNEPVSAKLARQHNNANVIALGARLVGEDMAKACVHAFLEANYEGGRHERRVAKLSHFTKESA